jgi:hypothetical protein
MNIKDAKIELAQNQFDDRVKELRTELAEVSDEDLVLAADRIYNGNLQSISLFFELTADQERDSIIEAAERGCSHDF